MEFDSDFLNNLLYPLTLLLVGGLVTGILVPIYTNKQKEREKEIEGVRKEREIAVEHEREDYKFKIKLKQELIDLFLHVHALFRRT